MKNVYVFIFAFLVLASIAACSSDSSSQVNQDNEANQENMQEESGKETTPRKEKMSEQQNKENKDETEKPPFEAERIMDGYKSVFLDLAKSAENDGKLHDIHTKDELMSHLQQKMSKELATWYVNTYFRIEGGEVYIKAMDSPTWLKMDQSFDVQKLSDQHYEIKQERDNQLLGHVNMIYVIKYNGDNWVVHDIKQEKMKNDLESKLNQDTSASISKEKAESLVREHLGLQGNTNMYVEVDHQEEGRFVVHVYEVVNQDGQSHTATYGWYYVDKETGKIESMF